MGWGGWVNDGGVLCGGVLNGWGGVRGLTTALRGGVFGCMCSVAVCVAA